MNKWLQRLSKLGSFVLLYCIAIFVLVPLMAKPFGRVPLPWTCAGNLRPLTVWTCILNRNYVRPALRDLAFEVAAEMNTRHPGTSINYLDANFPFIDRFPLVPHLSHRDGKKLDLAFCYDDRKTGMPSNEAPSFMGYGVSEEPGPNERDMAKECAGKGYWQYSLLKKYTPHGGKEKFVLNARRTADLVFLFADREEIGKIFIEPHLKSRLNLISDKIRFHGCHSVRHDDHIHVQIK